MSHAGLTTRKNLEPERTKQNVQPALAPCGCLAATKDKKQCTTQTAEKQRTATACYGWHRRTTTASQSSESSMTLWPETIAATEIWLRQSQTSPDATWRNVSTWMMCEPLSATSKTCLTPRRREPSGGGVTKPPNAPHKPCGTDDARKTK